MTRGTHQVGAFAAGLGLLAYLAADPTRVDALVPTLAVLGMPTVAPPTGWPALVGFLVGVLIGATAPDIDRPRRWWARFLAHTAFGGHRHLSHSLVGALLASALAALLLSQVAPWVHIVPTLPFLGFVAGYLSHLILDSLTTEGVPWFFPIQVYLGFPPWSGLRIRTGGLGEQFLAMPALLAFISWLGYQAGDALLAWWR